MKIPNIHPITKDFKMFSIKNSVHYKMINTSNHIDVLVAKTPNEVVMFCFRKDRKLLDLLNIFFNK